MSGFYRWTLLRTLILAFVVSIFLPSVTFAADKCCSYTVDASAPAWVKSIGDGMTFLKSADENGNCADPKDTPQTAPYAQWIEQSFFDGKCAGSIEDKSTQQAIQGVACCILTNTANETITCKERSGSTTCLEALLPTGKLNQNTQIVQGLVACGQIESCKPKPKTGVAPAATTNTQSSAGQSKKEWTREECEGVKGKNGDAAFMWIPPKNNPTAVTGAHCYVRPLETDLEIGIGDRFVIKGIDDYVNTAYKYALGFGVLFLVVTIMVSGIQWMVSGVLNTVNDAKERIKNACIGLLLLFGANIILSTINPQLTNLQAPLMHAIRPESFDTAKEEGPRCNPSEEGACSKYGPDYICKPTASYVGLKCQQQANVFLGVTFGGAAIAATAPFVVNGIIANGVRGTVQKVAEGAADAATSGGDSNQIVTDGLSGAIGGKAGAVIGAVGTLFGLGVADSLFEHDDNEPAAGYCVKPKADVPDMQVCQFDGECQSGRCLLTSTAACGAGRYGVCTSGQLRNACLIKGFDYKDTFFNRADSDYTKFGCLGVKCVDNGRGAAKDGIGVCSDGSDFGMACSDEVPCKNLTHPLECVRGFCREKGFFGTSGKMEGVMLDYSEKGNPRCVLPTDCNSGDSSKSQSLFYLQGTNLSGCIKPAAKELNLPARFLVPQVNQKIDASFYRELSTVGTCVTDRSYFNRYEDKEDYKSTLLEKMPQTCYVNFYSKPKYDPDTQALANYLTPKGYMPTGAFAKAFDIKKVGCGKEAACLIGPDMINSSQAGFTGKNFFTVKGSCGDELDSYKKVDIVDVSGNDYIGVVDPDKYYDRLETPNVVDLQYTSAGGAK